METFNKVLQHSVLGLLNCTYAYDVDPMWLRHFGLSAIPDPIGEIWESSERHLFFEAPESLTVTIYSADWADVLAGTRKEGEFTELQNIAYDHYLRDRKLIELQVEQALFKHYQQCIELIEYPGEAFKPVASFAQLLHQCSHWQLVIPWQDTGPRTLEISCRCPWEEEHGFTAVFEEEKLIRVD